MVARSKLGFVLGIAGLVGWLAVGTVSLARAQAAGDAATHACCDDGGKDGGCCADAKCCAGEDCCGGKCTHDGACDEGCCRHDAAGKSSCCTDGGCAKGGHHTHDGQKEETAKKGCC